jgi:hypothetical protein
MAYLGETVAKTMFLPLGGLTHRSTQTRTVCLQL